MHPAPPRGRRGEWPPGGIPAASPAGHPRSLPGRRVPLRGATAGGHRGGACVRRPPPPLSQPLGPVVPPPCSSGPPPPQRRSYVPIPPPTPPTPPATPQRPTAAHGIVPNPRAALPGHHWWRPHFPPPLLITAVDGGAWIRADRQNPAAAGVDLWARHRESGPGRKDDVEHRQHHQGRPRAPRQWRRHSATPSHCSPSDPRPPPHSPIRHPLPPRRCQPPPPARVPWVSCQGAVVPPQSGGCPLPTRRAPCLRAPGRPRPPWLDSDAQRGAPRRCANARGVGTATGELGGRFDEGNN